MKSVFPGLGIGIGIVVTSLQFYDDVRRLVSNIVSDLATKRDPDNRVFDGSIAIEQAVLDGSALFGVGSVF